VQVDKEDVIDLRGLGENEIFNSFNKSKANLLQDDEDTLNTTKRSKRSKGGSPEKIFKAS
jgi:hypothetical protein